MDFRGLTTKELAGYGSGLERYLKDPEYQKLIDDFAKSKGIGSGHLPEVQGVDQQLRMTGIDNAGSGDKLSPYSKNNEAVRKFISDKEVTKGIYNPATTLTDAQKKYLMELKNAPGAGKSSTMKEMLAKMTPEAMAEAFPGEAKMIMGIEAGLQAMRDQAGKYDYVSPFAKYSPSLEQMTSKGSGIGLGKILQSGAKVAQKVMPYVSGAGAALTALDLGQALSEVQDKGAAKIAADYKKEYEDKMLSESEKAGNVMQTMNPLKAPSKEYSPEERVKLKDMLDKLRGNPKLRGSVSQREYPVNNTSYDAIRNYLKNQNPQGGKEFDGYGSYSDTRMS